MTNKKKQKNNSSPPSNISNQNSNNTNSSMVNVKYTPVNKDDHEIFIDELYDPNKSIMNPKNDRAFDFSSINNYNSIFKYKTGSLQRQNGSLINESKPVSGLEKFINYLIIGLFYVLFAITLPFSLIFCLKKVKNNERIVVYRLGRIISPEYRPGYHILFPLIDSYQRFTTVLKEFCLPNLQILNHENGIVDTSTQIRYKINDAIKIANSVQDLNHLLKSVARSVLVSLISKKDLSKIEIEKSYIVQDVKEVLNEQVRKWGIEIVDIELTINSIVKDENSENQDPALKSISMVFKSLFGGSSSDDSAGSSKKADSSDQAEATANFLKFLTPFITPNEGDSSAGSTTSNAASAILEFLNPSSNNNNQKGQVKLNQEPEDPNQISPIKLLKLLQPLLNENLVKDINLVYEFHIKSTKNQNAYEQDKYDIYYLDLKNVPNGQVGIGSSLYSKADCIIRTTDKDLNDLIQDKLKPFTAYMSGRIEIDGDLQDVFKLKKLIKSVTSVINPTLKK